MAKQNETRVNEEIRESEVRLIDADGEQRGVVSIEEALDAAYEQDLDLVEVAASAKPVVCRIMDYGKYRFEQQKKQQEARKNQKRIQVKEVKFRPGTDEGDYQVKLRNLTRFLESGDKAKVTVRFRGREMAHQDLGRDLLSRIEADLSEVGTVEQKVGMEGRQMVMVLAPKK
ncbi:translation initiation factor IF-3 [Suttonella indologenes]|uniref:translation initiation factor IF-3 n=1 Tax=Suttonella indologenes TaxID=13276 RepID=UPI000E1C3923|nr:translation initiation factor IF-3 [Suttonella indologenes]